MLADLILLLVLILLNGLFAMSEIALVSSRRVRLQQMAAAGRPGARHALRLASDPTRFLASVQVGITSIGILNGAIGEGAVASRLQPLFAQIPLLSPHAEALALGSMVLVLTYASLILGELVPKRLGLTRPEVVASLIARPMDLLATAGRPLVALLSASTEAVLRVARVPPPSQPTITVEEIRVLLRQGAEEGAIETTEHEMASNVLNLDERHVGAVLTPRAEVISLDLRESIDVNRDRLRRHPHSVLPLCDGGLDNVVGFVRATRILERNLDQQDWDLRALAEPALFVPEAMTLMVLLQRFRQTHLPLALVIDEFGVVEGLVTLTDVISAIVGDLPSEPGQEPSIVRRPDGSWLLDGVLELAVVARALDIDLGALDQEHTYHTLGGLAMAALGRVPRSADTFVRGGCRFEIVDMDGNRVDRVLATRLQPPSSTSGDAAG